MQDGIAHEACRTDVGIPLIKSILSESFSKTFTLAEKSASVSSADVTIKDDPTMG